MACSIIALCSSLLNNLNSCKNLKTLKQIHASFIVSNGHELPLTVLSKLVSLFIELHVVDSSVSVLCLEFKHQSTYKLWKKRVFHIVVICFQYWMEWLCCLKVAKDLHKWFHRVAVQMRFESRWLFEQRCFRNALQLFGKMPHRGLVSWTSMIYRYVGGASWLFSEMWKAVGVNMLNCSWRETDSWLCDQKCFLNWSVSMINSILKMYADVGAADKVLTLFEENDRPDVVSGI